MCAVRWLTNLLFFLFKGPLARPSLAFVNSTTGQGLQKIKKSDVCFFDNILALPIATILANAANLATINFFTHDCTGRC